MVRVAVAVYCFSKYCKDLAVEFAVQARKRRRASLPDMGDNECPIHQWFVDADLEDLLATVIGPETRDQELIRAEAIKFLAERRTAHWVAAQNFAAGIAPTGCKLVDHYMREMRLFGLEARFGVDPPCAGRGQRLGRMARRWCQKMRVKWGLRRGHLKEGESLSREEIVQKAGVLPVQELMPLLSSSLAFVCKSSKKEMASEWKPFLFSGFFPGGHLLAVA